LSAYLMLERLVFLVGAGGIKLNLKFVNLFLERPYLQFEAVHFDVLLLEFFNRLCKRRLKLLHSVFMLFEVLWQRQFS